MDYPGEVTNIHYVYENVCYRFSIMNEWKDF